MHEIARVIDDHDHHHDAAGEDRRRRVAHVPTARAGRQKRNATVAIARGSYLIAGSAIAWHLLRLRDQSRRVRNVGLASRCGPGLRMEGGFRERWCTANADPPTRWTAYARFSIVRGVSAPAGVKRNTAP